MFCRSLFVHLYFFFWPLCCLFFLALRILITSLVSSTLLLNVFIAMIALSNSWCIYENIVFILISFFFDNGYIPFVIDTSLIIGFVTRLTRWEPPVEQKLLSFPKHLSLPPIFGVIWSLVLYLCFVDRCLCVFFFISIYRF